MTKIHAAITGVMGFVPKDILTNQDIEQLVDTNDEWILSRTGISQRRILRGDGLGVTDIALPAIKGLLEKTGTKPEEIELLIFCTVTPDLVFPASANILCDKAGLINAWGYDLGAACSGFLFGLSTGSKFIQCGTHKKVIVVGADKMSSIIDYTDRSTCIIFGDGGGAVLLEPSIDDCGLMDEVLYSDGAGRTFLHQKAGGSVKPASIATLEAREHYVFQEGKQVFRFAVTNMAEAAANVMERNNLHAEDIQWLVPHQANLRIIDATAERMGVGREKVMINIQKYGNTTNGTLPLCLWEWEKQLKKGDNLILAAFGGGFTWGAIWLKWAYNS